MRTIKFRGLRVDGQGWVYGSLLQTGEKFAIRVDKGDWVTTFGYYQIIAESVGQFTGLLNGEGKEIYEGDKLLAGESVILMQYSGRGFEGKYINESQLHDEPIKNNNYLYWYIIGNIHEK